MKKLCEKACEVCPLSALDNEDMRRDARNLSVFLGSLISNQSLVDDFRDSSSTSLRIHALQMIPGISHSALNSGLELAFIQAKGQCKKYN